MKKFLAFLFAIALFSFALSACNKSNTPSTADEPAANDTTSAIYKLNKYDYARLNYALGVSAGSFIKNQEITLDKNEFTRGLSEAFNNSATLTEQEIQTTLQEYFQLKRQANAEKELSKSKRFLDSVEKLDGVQKDPSGLLYRITEQGSGAQPNDSSYVSINYKASFINGEIFDQNQEGTPAILSLNQVIKGWVIGIPMLREGGKGTLYIPAELAYGEYGRDIVPGNATLVFEVELLKVLSPKEVELYKKGQLQ